jgi:hypothetical protein
MPLVSNKKEVAIWKLFNNDFGSNTFRDDARVIDKLAGDGNGKLSLAEVDEFERKMKADPNFEKRAAAMKGGWVSPGIVRSELERKQNTSDAAGALGYLAQGPQAVGAGLWWLLNLPLALSQKDK